MAKWKNVPTFVMASGFSHHVRNGPTCKDKWKIIYSDYCKVKDYMYTTGVNAYYWALLVQDRIALDLPHQFVREVYQIIEAFSSSWPIFFTPRLPRLHGNKGWCIYTSWSRRFQ